MRALITGIRGFAAEHLREHLQVCGDEVAGSSRNPVNLPPSLAPPLKMIAWKLGTRSSTREVLAFFREFRPEVIYHLSALSAPALCGGNGPPTAEALESNFASTQEIMEVMQALDFPVRLIFVSSSHVYASVSRELPFCREDHPQEPKSAYGLTKKLAEAAVVEATAAGRIDGVIARSFHHSGPRQKPPGVLPEWLLQLADPTKEVVEVYSMRANLEVTDVRDVVRAYRLLAEKGVCGEAYNIGCGLGRFSEGLWERMLQVTGIRKPYREIRPAAGMQNPLADIRKITALTGWKPKISLDQTLRDMFEEIQQRQG